MHNFLDVRFAPSTSGGKRTGQQLRGKATPLAGQADHRAAVLINREYPILQGVAVPLAHRVRRFATQHYEVTDIEARGIYRGGGQFDEPPGKTMTATTHRNHDPQEMDSKPQSDEPRNPLGRMSNGA
jgi:hypothetical protein